MSIAGNADPIDRHVGARVRERRQEQGMTQNMLGRRIGVTFQAVQKYETGAIRIAASTLYRIGEALGVSPGYFFEGYAPRTDARAD